MTVTVALILNLMNVIQAAIGWLGERGLTRDRVIALLNQADTEGRDVSSAEVQTELDLLQAELDKTGEKIKDVFDPSD